MKNQTAPTTAQHVFGHLLQNGLGGGSVGTQIARALVAEREFLEREQAISQSGSVTEERVVQIAVALEQIDAAVAEVVSMWDELNRLLIGQSASRRKIASATFASREERDAAFHELSVSSGIGEARERLSTAIEELANAYNESLRDETMGICPVCHRPRL